MDELIGRDATEQIAALNAGKVSAVELLKAQLARHEQTHAALNAASLSISSGPWRGPRRSMSCGPKAKTSACWPGCR
jgi:hypothetical protein